MGMWAPTSRCDPCEGRGGDLSGPRNPRQPAALVVLAQPDGERHPARRQRLVARTMPLSLSVAQPTKLTMVSWKLPSTQRPRLLLTMSMYSRSCSNVAFNCDDLSRLSRS